MQGIEPKHSIVNCATYFSLPGDLSSQGTNPPWSTLWGLFLPQPSWAVAQYDPRVRRMGLPCSFDPILSGQGCPLWPQKSILWWLPWASTQQADTRGRASDPVWVPKASAAPCFQHSDLLDLNYSWLMAPPAIRAQQSTVGRLGEGCQLFLLCRGLGCYEKLPENRPMAPFPLTPTSRSCQQQLKDLSKKGPSSEPFHHGYVHKIGN